MPTLHPLDPAQVPHPPRPDAHWQVKADSSPAVLASCSLWWQGTPPIPGQRVGAIGHLQQQPGAPTAASDLLRQACDHLRQQGCTLVLAPLDGTTWFDYRCRVDLASSSPNSLAERPGDPPPTPHWGEPRTHPAWQTALAAAGFAPVATYESRRCLDLHRRYAKTPAFPALHLTTAEGIDPEALLTQIHPLIHRCFRHQPLFQPLPLAAFCQLYRPLLPQLLPEFIHLAYDGDALVGLLLALADPRHGLILKTLVVYPTRQYAGLGYVLIEAAHGAAQQRGISTAVHALMHQGNPSRNLSRRYGQPWRRYHLWGQSLVEPE